MTEQATATDARRHNFFIVDNEAVDNYDLNPHAGWLYVVILRHINQQTGVAFPSLATLADKTNMSEPTVIKYLEVLQEKKLITIKQQKDKANRTHKPNHYKAIGVVKEVNQGGKAPLQGVVKEVNTNNTKVKKTKEQESSKDIAPEAQPAKPEYFTSYDVQSPLDPVKEASKRSNGTIPASMMNPMKDAIALVFEWQWDSMTKSEKGQIQRTSKELCGAGVTPFEVQALHAYCAKEFTHFKPLALAGNVQQWRKTVKPSNIGKPIKAYIHVEGCPAGCNRGKVLNEQHKTIQCPTCAAKAVKREAVV